MCARVLAVYFGRPLCEMQNTFLMYLFLLR